MGAVRLAIKVTAPRIYLRRVERAIYLALDDAVESTLRFGVRYAKRKAPVRKVTRGGRAALTRELTPAEISELPAFAKKGLSPISGRNIRTGELPRTTIRRDGASRLVPETTIKGKTYRLLGAKTSLGRGRGGRDVVFDERGEAHMRDPRIEGNLYRSGKEKGNVRGFLDSQGRNALSTQRGIYTRHVTANVYAPNPRGLHRAMPSIVRHGTIDTLGGRLRGEINGQNIRTALAGGISEGLLESPTEYAKYVEFPTSRTAAQPYMRPAREAMKPVLMREVRREFERIGGRVF